MSDQTAFEMHKNYYQINDTDMIHEYMRMYYAHLVNGVRKSYLCLQYLLPLTVSFFCFEQVSNRFQYSFENDPDMKLSIVLTNILFLENVSIN